MKDINEVLRNKETELQQLQKEIEVLRMAARLLADDYESTEPATLKPAPSPSPQPVRAAQAPVAAAGSKGAYSAAWDNAPKQFP